jgi:hypothetical protein
MSNGEDHSIFYNAVRILFAIGIVIAVVSVLRDPSFPPREAPPVVALVIVTWLIIGGLGVVTGAVAWKAASRGIAVLSILLVVSLTAILMQPYNPNWLQNIVFWVRVFVAHLGLAYGALGVLFPKPGVP